MNLGRIPVKSPFRYAPVRRLIFQLGGFGRISLSSPSQSNRETGYTVVKIHLRFHVSHQDVELPGSQILEAVVTFEIILSLFCLNSHLSEAWSVLNTKFVPHRNVLYHFIAWITASASRFVVEYLHSDCCSNLLANATGYSTPSMTFESTAPKLLSLSSVFSTKAELQSGFDKTVLSIIALFRISKAAWESGVQVNLRFFFVISCSGFSMPAKSITNRR